MRGRVYSGNGIVFVGGRLLPKTTKRFFSYKFRERINSNSAFLQNMKESCREFMFWGLIIMILMDLFIFKQRKTIQHNIFNFRHVSCQKLVLEFFSLVQIKLVGFVKQWFYSRVSISAVRVESFSVRQ